MRWGNLKRPDRKRRGLLEIRTPPTMWHPDLVRSAAEFYRADLERTLQGQDGPAPETRKAMAALIDSITAALAVGPSLDEIPFTRDLMAKAPAVDMSYVLSQTQIGWGNDGARLIAMGTEQNYDLSQDAGLGTLAIDCASHVIWLTGSKPGIMATLKPDRPGEERFGSGGDSERLPYHRYVAEYQPSGGRGGTWQRLGKDVLLGGTEWKTVLGDQCYLIELKAVPSHHAAWGETLNESRLNFLRDALSEMSSTARVVLFHGVGTHEAARRLIPSFLRTDSLPMPTPVDEHRRGAGALEQYDANDRRALLTWAMSAHFDRAPDYLALVADLVQEKL